MSSAPEDEVSRLRAELASLYESLVTPTLQLRPRLVVMPLVGHINAFRADRIVSRLLDAIRKYRARVVVLDLSSVPALAQREADRIADGFAAARLLGARVMVSGVSEVVAPVLTDKIVQYEIQTFGDLQAGFAAAEAFVAAR